VNYAVRIYRERITGRERFLFIKVSLRKRLDQKQKREMLSFSRKPFYSLFFKRKTRE
jgi:hypothetical protein